MSNSLFFGGFRDFGLPSGDFFKALLVSIVLIKFVGGFCKLLVFSSVCLLSFLLLMFGQFSGDVLSISIIFQ